MAQKKAAAKRNSRAPSTKQASARPLPPRQQRFVDEYLVDLNATQAAIRAGYSAKTAEASGPRLLGNVGVAAAIESRKAERAEKVGFTADNVLRELSGLATSNVADFLEPSGEVKTDITELPREITAQIAEIQTETYVDGQNPNDPDSGLMVKKVKLKLHSKLKALELAGKHVDVQAFLERLQHEISPVADELRQALERRDG